MQPAKQQPKAVQKAPAGVDTSGSLFSMRAFHAERDLPIVYSANYNISLWGLELLHQFDTKKYAKIADFLNDDFLDTPWPRLRQHDEQLEEEDINQGAELHRPTIKPRRLRFLKPQRPINHLELLNHHSEEYLAKLNGDKSALAKITEVWLLNLIPQAAIESRLLNPLKWQVAGSIYAAHLAMQHGWAVNLAGGFHQASAGHGETFCVYSDVMLTMKYIWRKHPLQQFMIIDLDAHQATGLEVDIDALRPKDRKRVFMVDLFNNTIQPSDLAPDGGIDLRIELGRFTGDETYLRRLEEGLQLAFTRYKPTLVIYLAGQDVIESDSLGLMNLSEGGLKRRDELVFQWAVEKNKCPILMLLAGGYSLRGARLFADSLRNLYTKSLIWGGHRSGSRSLSRPKLGAKSHNSAEDSRGSASASSGRRTAPNQPEVAPTSRNSAGNSARKAPAAKVAQNHPQPKQVLQIPAPQPPAQPPTRKHIKTLSINTPPSTLASLAAADKQAARGPPPPAAGKQTRNLVLKKA